MAKSQSTTVAVTPRVVSGALRKIGAPAATTGAAAKLDAIKAKAPATAPAPAAKAAATAKLTREQRSEQLFTMQSKQRHAELIKQGLDVKTDWNAATKTILDREYPGRGRQPMTATKSPAEIAAEVKSLLGELAAATDAEEKKRIRRALRLRGHRGGLGQRVSHPVVAEDEE